MSVQVLPPPLTPAGLLTDVPTEPIYRLSVAQYHQMIAAGILSNDDPVELLEGWLVLKMSENPAHSRTKRLLKTALERLEMAGWFVDTQDAVTFAESEPEPDLVVVRNHADDYAHRHPGPQDLALVAEVADSSLRRDRGAKKRIYARAAIPIYWIVNIVDRQIEVYTGPTEQADYGQRQDYGAADSVPVVIGGQEVGRLAVSEVLP